MKLLNMVEEPVVDICGLPMLCTGNRSDCGIVNQFCTALGVLHNQRNHDKACSERFCRVEADFERILGCTFHKDRPQLYVSGSLGCSREFLNFYRLNSREGASYDVDQRNEKTL